MLDIRTEVEPELVEIAMRNLNESSAFRSSKQCQLLLRYIVEKSLAQRDDLLRERVIGAEVFGRAPDYDTGNDPIVRARVGEIRKRLAQYYQENRGSTVTITVPSGSYRAFFTQEESPRSFVTIENDATQGTQTLTASRIPESKQDEPHPQISGQERRSPLVTLPRIALFSCLIVVLSLGSVVGFRHHQEERNSGLTKRFWAPLIGSAKPPIIYIGANYFYRLSNDYLKRYRKAHNIEDTIPSSPIMLADSDVVSAKDLDWTHSYTGYGDVAATARIVSALTKFGSKYDLRYGDDITISDLHATPAILLGGYSNLWSIQLTQGFRYSLGHEGKIIDRDDKAKVWRFDSQNDYAIISRFDAKTAGFVLSIAGVGAAANQAAADFVGDPDRLGKLLSQAPNGWEDKNMQLVLHTTILNHVPISVDVQALYFW
jgi:hypothetical protein